MDATLSFRRRTRPLLPPVGLLWLVYGLFVACGVAQSAIVPLLPHLSARYGLSPSATALLLAVPGLATLAVSVPAGLAADRYGARRVTLGAALLLSVSCLAEADQSLALLMAGRIAIGIAFGIVWTTGVAWLAELDDGADGGGSARLGPSVTCSSVGVMAWAAALVLTPVLAGALEQHGGARVGYLAVILPCMAIAVALVAGARPWNVATRMTAPYSSFCARSPGRPGWASSRHRATTAGGAARHRDVAAGAVIARVLVELVVDERADPPGSETGIPRGRGRR